MDTILKISSGAIVPFSCDGSIFVTVNKFTERLPKTYNSECAGTKTLPADEVEVIRIWFEHHEVLLGSIHQTFFEHLYGSGGINSHYLETLRSTIRAIDP